MKNSKNHGFLKEYSGAPPRYFLRKRTKMRFSGHIFFFIKSKKSYDKKKRKKSEKGTANFEKCTKSLLQKIVKQSCAEVSG